MLFVLCLLGFLTMKGIFPLIPVTGDSMMPALRSGSLLVIKTVVPGDIKVGNIVICNVPADAREYYHYPPVIIRRVIEITTDPSLLFHTISDNAGEDPFPIRPADIRGTAGTPIPYLGLWPLLFQNWLWLVFVLPVLALFAVFLYHREISRGIARLSRRTPAPVTSEEQLAARAPVTEEEITEKPADTAEPARPRPEKPARKAPKPLFPALKKSAPSQKSPPDEGLTEEALAARREIYEALDRLQKKSDKTKDQE